MVSLKQFIIDKSKKLNIDIIGFTDGEPLVDLNEYLVQRRENNIETEFEEKDLRKRVDPKLTMPSCKSIITIGISYNVNYKENPNYRFQGKLSKSTWGIDYHRVLNQRINELIFEISKFVDFNYKAYVDTGPLIERELANKSGIGYYGKNCSIINQDYGSFIFLGYILTDLAIEPNREESASQCGSCNLCIRACPTNALVGPYKLNTRRCISYLTQTRDDIPIPLRKKMGINIYGCDTCQSVCPKNKEVKFSNEKQFIPYITKGYMDIEEILKISNREFRDKYGSMAGSWRGRNILKRNSIIALANMSKADSKYYLEEIAQGNNPLMAEYARWALRVIL